MSRKEFFWEFEEDFAGRFNQNPRMLTMGMAKEFGEAWEESIYEAGGQEPEGPHGAPRMRGCIPTPGECSMKYTPSMSGKQLPKTRDLAPLDRERGKVGWAHWRSTKKKWTHRYRRRVTDRQIIEDQL